MIYKVQDEHVTGSIDLYHQVSTVYVNLMFSTSLKFTQGGELTVRTVIVTVRTDLEAYIQQEIDLDTKWLHMFPLYQGIQRACYVTCTPLTSTVDTIDTSWRAGFCF